MRVVLAGYNADMEHGSKTPETLSAAYARISRDPRPIGELRFEATREVARARASNRRIVFGYGHGSVAEHAFFNFDILDLSRLATEALQSFRLASFTEKSQRYIRLDGGWVVPPELPAGAEDEWNASMRRLFDLYSAACDRLAEDGLSQSRAREDARYMLPLAVTGQMGMSCNARELEHMVRRLSAHPLAEVRELAAALLQAASKVAPSLLRHLEPTAVDRMAWQLPVAALGAGVELCRAATDIDVGARLLQRSRGLSLSAAAEEWGRMDGDGRRKLFEGVLNRMGPHDAVPRDWELAAFTFELSISATAYAQLKRHRLSTQLVSAYSPGLGLRVPPSLMRAGLDGMLEEAASLREEWTPRLAEGVADYLLTNAHRRRVVLHVNARELYHISRLRMDSHAQWDIRELAGKAVRLACAKAPLTMAGAGGKSKIAGG